MPSVAGMRSARQLSGDIPIANSSKLLKVKHRSTTRSRSAPLESAYDRWNFFPAGEPCSNAPTVSMAPRMKRPAR
jgi:hypothetical protein